MNIKHDLYLTGVDKVICKLKLKVNEDSKNKTIKKLEK